jgi:hypothetical protein
MFFVVYIITIGKRELLHTGVFFIHLIYIFDLFPLSYKFVVDSLEMIWIKPILHFGVLQIIMDSL